MHLLPHKSWNVWSQENKEKVREDERKARLDAAQKCQREARVEAERRLELLRRNARLRSGSAAHGPETCLVPLTMSVGETKGSVSKDAPTPTREGSFLDEQCGGRNGKSSLSEVFSPRSKEEPAAEKIGLPPEERRRREEKAAELEKYALGYGAPEKTGKRPWYMQTSGAADAEGPAAKRCHHERSMSEKEYWDWRRKDVMDPMRVIEVSLEHRGDGAPKRQPGGRGRYAAQLQDH